MKIKTILISLFAILSTVFNITVKAETTAPTSFIIDSKDLYSISTTYYLPGDFIGGNLSMHFKQNANGDIVYCVEIHDYSVSSGTEKYTLSKELDAKYVYVLQNGYPNKSIFGNKNKDYFTTGLTVWYLSNPSDYIFKNFDFETGKYKNSNNQWIESDIVKEMAKLINGANNYTHKEPTIKINLSDNNLILSEDKKYYVSNNISVTTTGNITDKQYQVSLENAPSGTIVTDINGNEKSTFATEESFLVKIPVSKIDTLTSEFKVNVSAKGSMNKAYLYSPENSVYQNVTVLYPESKDIKDSTSLKLNTTTEVQISKIDVTTGEELPGATLTVKDSNGKVIDTWVSTAEPHVIKGLQPGKYTLTEEIAPEGYILSTETIEFEIKADGTVTKVVMENKPEDKPEEPKVIYISKQDITTGEELEGAYLELRNESGELIEAWVSTTEPHKIEGLEPGKYTLSETLAPEGYELTTETVEFIVKEDRTVDGDIIMYNKPETIVEVPKTSSFKTITASLIGIIIIGLGSLIIYKNYKKNEEN